MIEVVPGIKRVIPAGRLTPANPVRFVPPDRAEITAAAMTVNANAPDTSVAFVSAMITDRWGDIRLTPDLRCDEGRALVYGEGIGVGDVGHVD